MKSGRKYFYIILSVIALFILLEIGFRVIQRPNTINVNAGFPFLLQTTWNQTGDYAKFVEHDTDAGCWAVAIAQIAYYHSLIPEGHIRYVTSKGDTISEYPDTTLFKFERFVSGIDKNTPLDSIDPVARYIYYIAALIYTDFGSPGYLEHETMMARIEKHLGCDIEFYEYNNKEFPEHRDEIEGIIREEIDASRPMMIYFDDGKDFGHAAVIDGYTEKDNIFLVHLNMGWGGEHDGWYNAFDKFIGIRNDLHNRFLITFEAKQQNNY